MTCNPPKREGLAVGASAKIHTNSNPHKFGNSSCAACIPVPIFATVPTRGKKNFATCNVLEVE